MLRQKTLNDAQNIEELSLPQQESTMQALRKEIFATERELEQAQKQGTEPDEKKVSELLMMFALLSQARQCCPTCPSASMPMPSASVLYGQTCQVAPMLAATPHFTSLAPQHQTAQQQMQMRWQTNGMMQPQAQGFSFQTEPNVFPINAQTQALMPYQSYPTMSDNDGLAKGAKGAEVKRLQQLLTAAGFKTKADGIFGANTELNLTAFQRANKLTPDGVLHPDDMRILEAVAAKSLKVPPVNPPAKTDSESTLPDTLLRVGAPVALGVVAGGVAWKKLPENNTNKRILYSAGIGCATMAVSWLGTNLLADALVRMDVQEISA